jgi:aminodeoxyfutalosine deaminase
MRFLTAATVFPVSSDPIENGVIAFSDEGVIEAVMTMEQFRLHDSSNNKLESVDGLLCPGFINTHCHLELSYLKDRVAKQQGMAAFIRSLISQRFIYSEEERSRSYADAEEEMLRNGIVAVGDISNFPDTLDVKKAGRLYYHTFVEVYGLDPYESGSIIAAAQELSDRFASFPDGSSSIVPHAPYSVSPALFEKIKQACYAEATPVSIHMQESSAEMEFIYNGTGGIADLFSDSRFGLVHYKPYAASPVKAILPQLPICNPLLLVHNTYVSKEEIEWANDFHKHICWTLCPKANLYIENRLPAVENFIKAGAKITLGTDSLASNDTLSVLAEMNVLGNAFNLTFEQMLPWATINGAEALGIDERFGSLEKNKIPGIINIYKERISRII